MHIHDLYKSIAQSIITELEKGAVPWQNPWKSGNSGGILPVNYATRRQYNGINILILWAKREERGFPTAEWLTFKQASDIGGHVRKGEKGTRIVFTKKITAKDDDEEKQVPILKSFVVFNAAQIEGLEPKENAAHAATGRHPHLYHRYWRRYYATAGTGHATCHPKTSS
jgi:antirestriction protein ArdC